MEYFLAQYSWLQPEFPGNSVLNALSYFSAPAWCGRGLSLPGLENHDNNDDMIVLAPVSSGPIYDQRVSIHSCRLPFPWTVVCGSLEVIKFTIALLVIDLCFRYIAFDFYLTLINQNAQIQRIFVQLDISPNLTYIKRERKEP